MGWFDRKPKTQAEMLADPEFGLRVGRLLGAAELAGELLVKQADPQFKAETPLVEVMGTHLLGQVAWFSNPPSKGQKWDATTATTEVTLPTT